MAGRAVAVEFVPEEDCVSVSPRTRGAADYRRRGSTTHLPIMLAYPTLGRDRVQTQ